MHPVAARSCAWFVAAFSAALLLGPVLPAGFDPHATARADEAEAGEGEDGANAAPVELREASKEEAKSLLDALKKVYKKKNANQVLPALESMEALKHASWDKALIRLLKHPSSLVALKAAEMWSGRITPKNIKKVWKAAWLEKVNDKRYPVKTRVLRALAAAGHILDGKQYKEVERDWRWMIGNPNEKFAAALSDVCWYFETTKDKRHCRKMAEELDEPAASSPNSPSNPPADWWERRWKMWRPMKPAAVAALKAITGQEFDKTEEAKKWFKENEKTFGFEW